VTGAAATGATASGVAGAAATGATAAGATGTTGTQVSTQDQTFVHQAASSGLAEVEEGQYIVSHASSNPAAAEYGQWMVADGNAMNSTLSTIAKQAGVQVPTTLTSTQQSQLSALQGTSSSNLANVYASDQVVDQGRTMMQFLSEANSGQDQSLVSFAKSALPVLDEHMQGAVDLAMSSAGVQPPDMAGTSFLPSLLSSSTSTVAGGNQPGGSQGSTPSTTPPSTAAYGGAATTPQTPTTHMPFMTTS
jgi:putative membrane protein